MKTLAAIGRNSLDTYYDSHNRVLAGEKIITTYRGSYYGGMIANFAAVLASLGIQVTLYDTLNMDEDAQAIVHDLKRIGVDVSRIQFDRKATLPKTHIILPSGSPGLGSTIIVPRHDEQIYRFTDDDLLHLGSADIIYTTICNIRTIDTVQLHRFARENGRHLMLDVENSSFTDKDTDREIFDAAHIIFFNQLGFEKYAEGRPAEEFVPSLLNRPGKMVVVTRGKNGGTVYHEGGTLSFPGIPVDYIDTTGAGDTFNALFIWRWLKGDPVERIVAYANYGAALSTTGIGPRSILELSPDWESLKLSRVIH